MIGRAVGLLIPSVLQQCESKMVKLLARIQGHRVHNFVRASMWVFSIRTQEEALQICVRSLVDFWSTLEGLVEGRNFREMFGV
jgi:hypothetical protein